MIYFTQLIYIHPGFEKTFDEFEAIAIPAIARYNGKLLFRVRPSADAFIEGDFEQPYEIHLVSFPDIQDFKNFAMDEERKQFLHLKEQSIKTSILIQGEML